MKYLTTILLASAIWSAAFGRASAIDYAPVVNDKATTAVYVPAGRHFQSAAWDVSNRSLFVLCEPGAVIAWKSDKDPPSVLIDATNTRGLVIIGCEFTGDTLPREVGLRLKRDDACESIVRPLLIGVTWKGRFSGSAIDSESAEGLLGLGGFVMNQHDGGRCYRTRRSESPNPLCTNTMPATFIGTSFTNSASGPAIEIGDFTRQVLFLHGSIAAHRSEAAVVISGKQVRGVHLWGVDIETRTPDKGGPSFPEYAVMFTGEAGECRIDGGMLSAREASVYVAKGASLHGTITPFDRGAATHDVLIAKGGSFTPATVQVTDLNK